MAENGDKYTINAVGRSFRILDFIGSCPGPVSIQDVAAELECNSNMAFRLLRSLEDTGYVEKDQRTGLFSLSLKVLKLSRKALQSLEIRKYAMPCLEILWSQFPKANVNLALRDGDDILMVDRIDANQVPRTYFTPGKIVPFHCSGVGKVLVSALSDEEISAMIDRVGGLKAFTPETITDPEVFLREIAKVRLEGVGRDRNEYIPNDNCSAVPIMGADGKIAGAISTSALSSSMSAEEIENTIPELKKTASRISGMLGYTAL